MYVYVHASREGTTVVCVQLTLGAQVEIPLWLAQHLADPRGARYVAVKTPRCFTVRARQSLLADPVSVNLKDKNEYFYMFGLRLALL